MAAYTTSSARLSIQASDAKNLFEIIGNKMNWRNSNVSRDLFMDIGVGPEENSSRLLLTVLPRVKKCIAIDLCRQTIEFSRVNSEHPKLQFEVADICDRSTLERWEGKISKVISVNCYNCVSDQQIAFENTYRLLKRGGEAAIEFNLQSGFFDWFLDLTEHPEWLQYYDGTGPFIPASHLGEFGVEYYTTLLTNAGFEVLHCEEQQRRYTYRSDVSFKTIAFKECTYADRIPPSLRKEFEEDMMRTFIKHNGRTDDGSPCLMYKNLVVLLKKPN